MPITEKPKAGKGVPRRAKNPNRKAKYARYLKRSTCACGLVFRSPSKMKEHALTHKG